MQLALSAGTLHNRPLEEAVEIAAEAGFDGVEIIISQRFTVTQQESVSLLQSVQQMLPVLSIHAPFFEVDGWGNKISQLERSVDLALSAEVPLITFHPPSWLALEWAFRRWLNKFEDVQQELGQGKVWVTMENMSPGGPGYMCTKPVAMLDYLEKKNFYLTFDTAHMGATSPDLIPEFDRFFEADRVRSIHFSDYNAGKEHLLPGHGHLPLKRFLNRLREQGYDRSLVLELMPQELPSERKALVRALQRQVEWMRAEGCSV